MINIYFLETYGIAIRKQLEAHLNWVHTPSLCRVNTSFQTTQLPWAPKSSDPLSPGSPGNPLTPGKPPLPASPGAPSRPRSPPNPGSPGKPSSPRDPDLPLKPVLPESPLSPARPKTSVMVLLYVGYPSWYQTIKL